MEEEGRMPHPLDSIVTLNSQIGALYEIYGELQARLSPVLTPENPAGEIPEEPELQERTGKSRSPVMEGLETVSLNIKGLAAKMQGLIRRLDL